MPSPLRLGLAAMACATLAVACSGDAKRPASAGSSTTSTGDPASTSAPSGQAAASPPTTVTGFDPNAPETGSPGDIPDTQVFVPFTFSAGPFTVKVPEGWARNDQSGVTVFTDNFNSVQLQVVPASTAPTPDSAQQQEVPSLQASTTNFQLGKVSSVTRSGGPAVLITYTADSAPNQVTGKVLPLAIERYEFWKGGKEAIVTLLGPAGADDVDPWRTITDSFTWG